MIKLLTTLALALSIPAAAQNVPPIGQAVAVTPAVTAPAAPTLTQAQIRGNEMVCKSNLETGSLVKKHKQCFTRKQWAYVNDQHESSARKMVEDNSGKPAGN